jgi:hypothetical protein
MIRSMPEPEQPETEPERPEPEPEPIVARVTGAIEDGVRAAVNATNRRLDELPGIRARRLRRLARNPLPYLYEVHPEARQANPRELGIQTISVDEIAGTAVGPPGQRGKDFLPPRPLRTENWRYRWQRIRAAIDRLTILPPIDVQRYAGAYWVLDGHNRVAAALYVGQREIDANVVELVALAGTMSTTPTSLANVLQEHAEIEAALSRRSARGDPSGPEPGERGPERGSAGSRDGARAD